MELIRDICKGCGRLLPIVNKKYYLCDECNFKRLHDGKSKEVVYAERAASNAGNSRRAEVHRSNGDDKGGLDKIANIKGVTRASKIKSISSEKKFRCSDGTMVSQQEIKWRYAITCDKIKQTRLPVCQGTGRSDVPLSFSHTISQDRCKKLSKTELIWDEDNIELEGYEPPCSNPTMAHNIWEVGSMAAKIMLLNFERKLEYIRLHDQETYNKIIIKIEELENEYR